MQEEVVKQENKIKKEQANWHSISIFLFLVLVILATWLMFRLKGALPHDVKTKDAVLIGLAVFRMIRLLTYDYVTEFVRDFFSQYEKGPGRTLADLLSCPWCTGIWTSLLLVSLYFLTPFGWFLIFVLAMAGVGSFIQIAIWKIGLEKEK